MGNMCCKREQFAPNGTDSDPSRCGHQQPNQLDYQQHLVSKQHLQPVPTMSSAYHSAGDDCAINELLEGRMDLDVQLPDGRKVRLTVERRTPMMDLLVQAASATKISPGGHVIHIFGDGDKGNDALQYKPSTPIGSLDTKTICIVPKKEANDPLWRRTGKTVNNRPFEPTFRVQVHLPRNQLTVLRVSPRIKISELKSMVCKEKNLDSSRYQLVRPNGSAQPLLGDMTLAEYGSTEITLLSNSIIESHICNSSSHFISYSKPPVEPRRKTGILRLLTENVNNKINETSNLSSNCQVDGDNKKTKAKKSEEVPVHHNRYKPKKRRPAPPPPPPTLPEAPSHSRQSSSDSSGYHEVTSSFLHEENSSEEKASSDSSGVSSLDAKVPLIQPTPPPIPNSKKKKAPPPPPPVLKEKPPHRVAPKCPPQKQVKEPIIPKDFAAEETVVLLQHNNGVSKELAPVEDLAVAKSDLPTEDIAVGKESATPMHVASVIASVKPEDISVRERVIVRDSTVDVNVPTHNHVINKERCEKTHLSVQENTVTADAAKTGAPVFPQTVLNKTNGPSRTTEFTITTYSGSPQRNPIIGDNTTFSESNDLAQKDYNVTKKSSNAEREEIVHKDHVIPKEKAANRFPESKLDPFHIREGEGRLQMTVAAKAVPSTIVPTDPVKGGQSELAETPLLITKEGEDIRSSVLDTHEYRRPEKRDKKDSPSTKGEAVSTRVALVALNARIEQDVTQQEIASSIQAAFHSVDCSPQPSLLAIKQRNSEDSDIRSGSLDSTETTSLPLTTTKISLNVDTCDNSKKEQRTLHKLELGNLEREAVLIDEKPSPRPTSTGSSKGLRRTSSLLNFTDITPRNTATLTNTKRARNLQRSLSDLSTDGKEDFEAEQERLQKEYIKLQRQFILWQQQLMNNHAMLREECIVPQYARTLRQSHSLPEGEDTFEENAPPPPLISRSLSYEPTKDRCSTLPRSAINITSLEFGSIPLGNGTSTLRSSKTKSYFKPPQIRASTKNRQRLPPEIKKEGDVDITDDAKMLTTILPSFESLKLITENNDEDRLKDTIALTVSSYEGRKKPVLHLSSTFPKSNFRLNNGDKAGSRDLRCVNGNAEQSKNRPDCPKATEQSAKEHSAHPPPPPPMPSNGVSKCSFFNENFSKSTGQCNSVLKKDFTSDVDPRERLMLEIRKFGGRTALRKISLAS